MSDAYIGEIRMFGGNFAPQGWAFCNGSLLPINDYDALYTLLGTTFGGDGQNTFALPNLQGRLPVDQGTGYVMGQVAGSENVTLSGTQLPSHTHPFAATSNTAGANSPAGAVPAATSNATYETTSSAPSITMAPQSIAPSTGGGQPHSNMMPYLAVSFIISLYGIYPPRS